ncbi:hypothetical protein DGMP_21610 [Desulfomarina profundi]|uniref:Lipocalin-like domain-containing protein n=1 Tax=Desulfomarina profundi TaxID=2772557 RepID=A0A8D5FHK6_9BACT|nr:hypothetical protein [Desulfomarina profundi]BCL61468.1 hypothetical protein DGMP_21610 [Desulfomarina profundi]
MGNRSTLFGTLSPYVGVLLLAIAVAFSPMLSVCAAEEVKIQAIQMKVAEQAASVPVLGDHKKDVVLDATLPEKESVLKESKVESSGEAVGQSEEKEGWSTLQKVGLGVGVVAVVGVAAAALGGGISSSDEPAMPTSEELVGVWRSTGTSLVDHRTYRGTYDFYAIGNHIYDIVVSTGEHKRGRGTWFLEEGTKILHVRNDTGSHYVGEFEGEDFRHILLKTTNGRWKVVLDKI